MNIKKVIAQIEKKQELEENFRTYGAWLMGAANRYCAIRLALNYYTFFETMAGDHRVSEELMECSKEFHSLLASYLENVGDSRLEGVDRLRRRVIASMEKLSAYTDCFQNYEYVLNRMEYRFSNEKPAGFSEELFSRELMEYIMGTEDRMVMNSRIQEVVEQLPVRMTKAKFFHLLHNALSIYQGSDRESVDNLLYMIKTSAMLTAPKDLHVGCEDLFEILGQFKAADYKNMDADQYREYSRMLQYVSDYLNDVSGDYMLLQDMINDLYVLMLSAPYISVSEVRERDACFGILSRVNQHFEQMDNSVLEDELGELLVALEGKQEGLFDKYFANEFLVDRIKLDYQEELKRCGEGELYDRLFSVEKLMSTSPFVQLEESDKSCEKADEAYIAQAVKELEESFGTLFSEQQRAVSRAVMAKTLSMLPVFFNSADEIGQYIKSSLNSCQDAAEKQSCMELLKGLMNSENEMV